MHQDKHSKDNIAKRGNIIYLLLISYKFVWETKARKGNRIDMKDFLTRKILYSSSKSFNRYSTELQVIPPTFQP